MVICLAQSRRQNDQLHASIPNSLVSYVMRINNHCREEGRELCGSGRAPRQAEILACVSNQAAAASVSAAAACTAAAAASDEAGDAAAAGRGQRARDLEQVGGPPPPCLGEEIMIYQLYS